MFKFIISHDRQKMAVLASGHLGPNVPDLVGLENNSEIVIVTTQSQEEMEQQIVLARFKWKRSANLEIASVSMTTSLILHVYIFVF